MHYLKNIKFQLLIIIIISLSSCQPDENQKSNDFAYTIDTIYVTKSRDTGVVSNTVLWVFNNEIPLLNIETINNNDTTIYIDSSSAFPGLIGNLVSKTSCINNVIKSIYTSESGFTGERLGNAIFYNQDKLDSVIFYDPTFNWTNPFVPLKKTFITTYTNNNLDSLAVNVSSDGYLTLSNTRYGDMLHFNYSSLNNQKQLIGLDVNEFLYIRSFFCRFHLNYSLIPYGQHIMMMDENHNSLNTNCKNLLSEIQGTDKRELIDYVFDAEFNNRIKEIIVFTYTATDNYIITYKLHYKP